MQRLENWDDLRFFLAVARSGGLSAASRELGVNQSTVSRRITQLEAGLDARLFDRHARGYSLTPVGEDMLALVTRVEDDVLAVDRTVLGADRELRGVVRITSVDEVLEAIAPHLRTFRDRYPGIELELNSELRTYSLARREADVAIRPGPAPTEPEVVGRKLVLLPIAAYASRDYLENRSRPRRAAQLKDHELIAWGPDHRGELLMRKLVGDARIAVRANSMTAQAIAAGAGLGVAVLPRFMADPRPELVRLFAIEPKTTFHLWLLIHADLRQTARVRAFVDFMTQAVLADRALYEGRGRKN